MTRGRVPSRGVRSGWRRQLPTLVLVAVLAVLARPWPRGGTPPAPAPTPRRVAPGVTLWGVELGGVTEPALRGWLGELAPALVRPPEDARPDPATGGVIPELDGAALDAEATARAVLAAGPGPVEPVFTRLPARVRLADFPDRPLWQGHPAVPEATLMINVAWGDEHLPPLLRQLRQAGARVTFFLTGRWVERSPQLARAIAAEGHEIASHGYADSDGLAARDAAAWLADFRRAAAAIARVTGVQPRFVSTHQGVLTPAVREAAARAGQRLVMWSVDTIDWQDPPPSRILARVERKLAPGALILAHPRAVTVEALPGLLELLRARGLRPVPLGSLVDPAPRPELLPRPGPDLRPPPLDQGQ